MKLVVNNDKAIPESGRGVSNRKTDHVRATILEMNEKGDWVGFTDEKEARNFYSRAYYMSQRGETKGIQLNPLPDCCNHRRYPFSPRNTQTRSPPTYPSAYGFCLGKAFTPFWNAQMKTRKTL